MLLELLLSAVAALAPEVPPQVLGTERAIDPEFPQLGVILPEPYKLAPGPGPRTFRYEWGRESRESLAVEFVVRKTPLPAAPPAEADLRALASLQPGALFTALKERWQDLEVRVFDYSGTRVFKGVEQKVAGRLALLPLEPGTVVVNSYADPFAERVLRAEWTKYISTVRGKIHKVSTPRSLRKGLTTLVVILGFLVYGVGFVMMLRQMFADEAALLAYLSFVAPIIPPLYGAAHYERDRKTLLILLGGIGLAMLGILTS